MIIAVDEACSLALIILGRRCSSIDLMTGWACISLINPSVCAQERLIVCINSYISLRLLQTSWNWKQVDNDQAPWTFRLIHI